ncbi:methionine--tRNA ligase [Halobacteriovorax sp. RZ-2]|uniref:methionine--tRNA ligase n=1 Tax=unclassified Halobacteriovorax TaxID=2639665 RepID=UPI00371DF5DF
MTKNTFYATTAIDYPNGRPHIGHAYEKIVTDSYVRWNKLLGKETHFLTGTDENGQKLIESAKAAGLDTLEFVNANVEVFKELCTKANIQYNDFIRTTEERHADTCVELWKNLEAKGLIYHGHYSGNYCLSCESFYTEAQAPDGNCPEHHKPLELKEEEGFFFKLSEYQKWIIDHLKANPDFIVPQARYKEILSRLENDDLRDLAISRPSQGWGVPVPGNENFVMYTWFDALINYYSALNTDQREKFWPADMHVIGKDILWFHSVIWPCMLKAADLPLPKQVYVHGMVLAEDGKKMSKSLGNVVDPFEMLEKYPTDTFRYYMLKNISSSGDGKFSEQELVDKHNSELANDYGNLLMRVIKLGLKSFPDKVYTAQGVTQEIDALPHFERAKEFMERREHNKAIDAIWDLIVSLNQYVNDKEPWKHKADEAAFAPIAYNCFYGMAAASYMLQAFLPECTKTALEYIGSSVNGSELMEFGKATYTPQPPEALFPKVELK